MKHNCVSNIAKCETDFPGKDLTINNGKKLTKTGDLLAYKYG